MGYEATYHPIAASELQYYVFDVIDNFALAPVRAREISAETEDIKRLLSTYVRMQEWMESFHRGEPVNFSSTFGYATCSLAGYLHPYWYAGGSVLSFLAQWTDIKPRLPEESYTYETLHGYAKALKAMITPLPEVGSGAAAALPDSSDGLIRANYTASGFMKNEDLPRVIDAAEQFCLSDKWFDIEGINSLNHAVDYAQKHGLGLLEASDIVVPKSSECFSKTEHLRAAFLRNQLKDVI